MKCEAVQPRLVPLLLLALVCVLGTSRSTCAQALPSEMPNAESSDLIRESELRVRLEDEEGNLHPVPGFTLERFRELLALESRLKEQQEQQPQIVFTNPSEFDGKVDESNDFATWSASFHVKVNGQLDLDEPTWHVIQLELGNAFLDLGSIEHDGQGEMFVTRNNGSYVCWLKAMPETSHTIRIPLKTRVHRIGSRQSISLRLPDTSTTLTLSVPEKALEVSSPNEQLSLTINEQGRNSIVEANGAGGLIDMAWQPKSESTVHALDATSFTTFHIYGNLVRSEAHLSVRSRSEPIDSFVVTLPDEMQVDTRRDDNFQIIQLPSDDENKARQVLIKRTAGLTNELMEVHLEATHPPLQIEKQRRLVNLSGFHVNDAVREWGSVNVSIDGNWSPNWKIGKFVQRVAVPEAPDPNVPVTAKFLYDRQPFSLQVELKPKRAKVSLDATYVVDVTADQLRLEAVIEGTTNGANIRAIELQIPDWQLDSVTSDGSPIESPSNTDSNILLLPLDTDDSKFEFRILASRDAASTEADISFELPRPVDASLQTNANLSVRASDNVELTPDASGIKWLSPEQQTSDSEGTDNNRAQLVYRQEFSSNSNEYAKFVARRRLLSRETSLSIASTASLDNDSVRVSQAIAANVAYEALSELEIEIPNTVLASDSLTITSDGSGLEYRIVEQGEPAEATTSNEEITKNSTIAAIVLPEPFIGTNQFDLAFEVPQKDIISADGLRIPLVQPVKTESVVAINNDLTIEADDATAVTLVDEAWPSPSVVASADTRTYQLQVQAKDVKTSVLVHMSMEEGRPSGAIALTRAWIQSWSTPVGRSDRTCFLLRSDSPNIRVQLPPTAKPDNIKVLVDGEEPFQLGNKNGLAFTVTLSDSQVGNDISLELWYYNELLDNSHYGVGLPTIENASRAERVYWQIVLPRNEHLAWLPATLAPELVWQRDQWHWGRYGRLEQAELEKLVNASSRDAVPADTNRYLFSSMGSVNSVGFTKVSRSTLLLVASGITLGVVLPFVYLPGLRRPSMLFITGVMLFGLAVTYPEYAVLAGQAGAIGLALALLAMVLSRFVGRTVTVPTVHRGSVHLPVDSKISDVVARRGDGSSRATTATAPAHLQVAQVEGEP